MCMVLDINTLNIFVDLIINTMIITYLKHSNILCLVTICDYIHEGNIKDYIYMDCHPCMHRSILGLLTTQKNNAKMQFLSLLKELVTTRKYFMALIIL